MQLRYSLYLLAFLSAAYTTQPLEKAGDTLKPVEQQKPIAEKQNALQEDKKPLDAGVEIIPINEEWARQKGVMDLYQTDPGFAKWFVSFHDIPGSPPYAFEQKRLMQALPDRYFPFESNSSEDILRCKNSNKPIGFMVNSRGYLPGEKVVFRLSAKGACREAVFYPRPLLLKRKSGELLASATLLCAVPGQNLYAMDICGVGKQEKYKFTSYSGSEVLSHNLEGPIYCTFMPEVVGLRRGVAKIVLQFEKGERCSMELPWGSKLFEYSLGNK